MAKAREISGLSAELPFDRAAAATVGVRAQELFAHADGVLDTDDIERVHDMRVASRRLRAVLEVYAACFDPAQHRAVLTEVKALADALGARRDPDVQLDALTGLAAKLPAADGPGLELLAGELRAEQRTGNAELAAALARAEDDGLAERLQALVAAAARGEAAA